MVDRVADAVAAYANTALRGSAPGLEARDRPGPSFADMVGGMMADTVQAGRQAEAISLQSLTGRADLNDVVLAVNNAEIGLQTMVGIRDKIIEAYQDVLRMPI